MTSTSLAAVLALSVAFAAPLASAAPRVGAHRAAVTLTDGWDRELDLSALSLPLLMFYEGKDSRDQNAALKADLAALEVSTHSRAAVREISVAEVSAYSYWPAKGIVKDEIKKWTARLGVVVYADFSGEARTKLALTPGQSNVVLYARDGSVLFAHAGTLSEPDRVRLSSLLRALVPTKTAP